MRRHPLTVALVAWTLLVWATRIGNIWRDADLGTGTKVLDTILAGSFVVLAVAVVAAALRSTPAARRWAVAVLAGSTAGVWVVRSADILLDDWSVGFKAVHTGLAAISVGLAVAAARAERAASVASTGPEPSAGSTGPSPVARPG